MSSKHWSWGYFFTDGFFFRNNNSYKNAWCIACLNHHKELLLQSDVINAAISGTSSELDAEVASDNLGDINDPLDFDQLSDQLMAGAASASTDKDVGDVDDDELLSTVTVPAPPLTITIPPLNSATRSLAAQPSSTLVKVFIPLRILFKYPTDKDLPSDGMNTFWRGGIQNLENELEAYELLSESAGEEIMEITTDEINPGPDVLPNNTGMHMNY